MKSGIWAPNLRRSSREVKYHVSLVRVDVFKSVDANTQTEEAGGEPKYEPCRTEENKDGCQGPEPFLGEADGEIAAKRDA